MTNYSEAIAPPVSLPVSLKPVRKRNQPTRKVPSFTIVHKKVTEQEAVQSQESTIPYDKWIMPPQPEGYLKCSGHNFF